MTARPLALAGLAAGLVAAAVFLLRPGERPPAAPSGPDPKTSAAGPAAAQAPSSAAPSERDALARAFASRLERALEAPEEEPPMPTTASRLEAEVGFEVIMEKIEGLADLGKRVPKRRRERLYRAANDAFSALSGHLDPGSARDMATLEEAHSRLRHMLGEIGAKPL